MTVRKILNRYRSASICCVALLFGGVMMTAAYDVVPDGNEIVNPGVASEAKTLDLYSEDRPLGPDDSPILVKEGKVTYNYNGCSIKYLKPNEEKSLSLPVQVDRKKWDVYSVYFPFTLHETPANRHYKKLIFHFSLSDPAITALYLYPKEVETKQEIEKEFGVSPELGFKDINVKLGSYHVKERFTRFRSRINAAGVGQHAFYWTYSGFAGEEVPPGDKQALAVLKVPRGTRQLRGEIYYQAVMAKEWLGGIWRTTEANSAKDRFTLDLKR